LTSSATGFGVCILVVVLALLALLRLLLLCSVLPFLFVALVCAADSGLFWTAAVVLLVSNMPRVLLTPRILLYLLYLSLSTAACCVFCATSLHFALLFLYHSMGVVGMYVDGRFAGCTHLRPLLPSLWCHAGGRRPAFG
jgi:hypothetical protein